jgi:glycosyltransferase involved in cell wall biosynthesis
MKAFEFCRRNIDAQLVVIGKDCEKYVAAFRLSGGDLLNSIHFSDWVEQEDLPTIYSLADVFTFPSV